MAGKKLARYVTVDGRTYGPDDDMSAEVAKKIENPKAFEEDAAAAASEEEKPLGAGPARDVDPKKFAASAKSARKADSGSDKGE